VSETLQKLREITAVKYPYSADQAMMTVALSAKESLEFLEKMLDEWTD
jgi:hypothetical protein